MPMIIPILAIAAAAAIGTTAALVIGTIVAVGLSMTLARKTSGVASTAVPGTTYQTNPQQLTFSNDAPRRLVYGKSRVSGIVAYANIAGDGNEYLYMVVVVAAHKIYDITAMYFDGDEVSTKFAGFYEWNWHDGTQTTADAGLMAVFPEWNSFCILKGCAYAVVKMKYDKSVYKSGQPNIQFDVKGMEVYDPRDGTIKFSNNAALCIADFLTNENGLSATHDEMDWDSVKAAADISAQIPDGMQASLCDGRYTIDGVVELSTKNGTTIDAMCSSFAGTVVWSEGIYRLFAGAARSVVGTITAEDLRDAPTVQPHTPSDQSFNCVKGTFMDSTNGWVMNDFPPVIGDEYIADDGGIQIFKDIVLQFTTSPLTAQRLGNIFLRRARLEGIVTLPCKWTVFNYEVWDVIALNLPQFGWVSKQFQITDWKMIPPGGKDNPGGIELQLQEYNSDSYSDNMTLKPISAGGSITVPDVTLAKPVSGLYATSGASAVADDGSPRIRFDWPVSADVHCVGYELCYGLVPFVPTAADWFLVAGRTTSTYTTGAVLPGSFYEGFIRTVNNYEKRSTETNSNEVMGAGVGSIQTEPLFGLTASIVDDLYVDISWLAPTGTVTQTNVLWSPDPQYTNGVIVAIVKQPQNMQRLRRELDDGYYFAAFQASNGLIGDPDYVAAAAQTDNKAVLQRMTLSKYQGDITNAVWYKGDVAVVKSSSLASSLGWELFDKMVPNPYNTVEYWNKNSRHIPSGQIRVSGSVGWARQPATPGVMPILGASVKIDYSTYTDVKQGTSTLAEPADVRVGFKATAIDPNGVQFFGFNGALEYTGLAINDVAAIVSSWGDIKLSWMVYGALPAGEQFTVTIFDPSTGNIVWTKTTTEMFAYFDVESSVPIFNYPPTYLSFKVTSPNSLEGSFSDFVPLDNSFVEKIIVGAGQSNMFGYYSELSGTNARHDLVAAATIRRGVASAYGLANAQVMPLNTSLGSSAADKRADDDPVNGQNYWYDWDGQKDGPRLNDFFAWVTPIASKVVAILWAQGENDASASVSNPPSYSTPDRYRDVTNRIFDRMRSLIPASQCKIIFQPIARSYWNDIEAAGAPWQLYRNVQRAIVTARADTILGTWVTGAERVSGYVPETGNPGKIHFIKAVYQNAAPQWVSSIVNGTDLINSPPMWVDMPAPTGGAATRNATDDIVMTWAAGSATAWDVINTDVTTGAVISHTTVTTPSLTFTHAQQVAQYGYNAGQVVWSVSIYNAANDVLSPNSRFVVNL